MWLHITCSTTHITQILCHNNIVISERKAKEQLNIQWWREETQEILHREMGEFAKIVCPQEENKKLSLKFDLDAYIFCGQI